MDLVIICLDHLNGTNRSGCHYTATNLVIAPNSKQKLSAKYECRVHHIVYLMFIIYHAVDVSNLLLTWNSRPFESNQSVDIDPYQFQTISEPKSHDHGSIFHLPIRPMGRVEYEICLLESWVMSKLYRLFFYGTGCIVLFQKRHNSSANNNAWKLFVTFCDRYTSRPSLHCN